MTSVLILTCARRGLPDPWQYISELIAQLQAEDAPVRHGIVCDGAYSGPRPEGWTIFEFDRAGAAPEADPELSPGFTTHLRAFRGNKLPYFHLLDVGRKMGGEIVALEDDVILSRNAIRRMISFLVPRDLAWVQFFSPRVLTGPDSYPGLWRPPLGSSLFLQATKYPAWALESLCQWKETHPKSICFAESDTSLALAAKILSMKYGVHSPDLVQHRGESSEANEGSTLDKWRISQCWGGKAFDCLSLAPLDDLYR